MKSYNQVLMLADLRWDYEAMSGMVFGPIPTVDDVVEAIADLEQQINRVFATLPRKINREP